MPEKARLPYGLKVAVLVIGLLAVVAIAFGVTQKHDARREYEERHEKFLRDQARR